MKDFYLPLLCLLLFFHTSSPLLAQYGVELVGQLDFIDQNMNDVWGYVDGDGNEYALIGSTGGVHIIDISSPEDPELLHSFAGHSSTWRDIKVWKNHAYVVNEVSGQGMVIMDLSNLPTTVDTVHYMGNDTLQFRTAHNLWIDENGVCFVFDANFEPGGTLMLDLDADPTNPPLLGMHEGINFHDGYARGDTLWGAGIYDGQIHVVDVSDKTDTELLATIPTPGNATHSCWLDDSGDFLYATDETLGGYLSCIDVRELEDMQIVDQVRTQASDQLVPHNNVVKGNWIFTSWYAEGIIVHDATNPENLVQVAYFEMDDPDGHLLEGAWGMYPFLPSGNVLVSSMERGLYIFAPTFDRACYLEGTVTDANTNAPLANVEVTVIGEFNESQTNLLGDYETGYVFDGMQSVRFYKQGYYQKIVEEVQLTHGETAYLDAELEPAAPASISIRVRDLDSDQVLSNAFLEVQHDSLVNLITDENGTAGIDNWLVQDAGVSLAHWGHRSRHIPAFYISPEVMHNELYLQKGYLDGFNWDHGWTSEGEAENGWQRILPSYPYESIGLDPGVDISNDIGKMAMLCGQVSESGQSISMGPGQSTLTSPSMDLSDYVAPQLRLSYWFRTSLEDPDAASLTLQIESQGITTTLLQVNDGQIWAWQEAVFNLNEYIELSADVRFIATAYNTEGNQLRAGIDAFEVIETAPYAEWLSTEHRQEASLHLYPNPVEDFLQVETKGPYQLWLFDSKGNSVMEKDIASSQLHLDCSHLVQGIYFLQIIDDQGAVSCKKFVKQ